MDFKTNTYNTFMYSFEKARLEKIRNKIIKKAYGHVLEIGPGTGVNLNYYDKVEQFYFVEPEFNDDFLLKIKNYSNIKLFPTSVELLPLDDNSIDTIVFTLIFCSVIDPYKGLSELLRVLKPSGKIIFIEHIEPLNQPLKGLFNLVNPIWTRIASGCNLNRNTIELIEKVGFNIIEKKYFFKNSFVYGIAEIKE